MSFHPKSEATATLEDNAGNLSANFKLSPETRAPAFLEPKLGFAHPFVYGADKNPPLGIFDVYNI